MIEKEERGGTGYAVAFTLRTKSPPHSAAHLALPGGVLAESVEEGAGVEEAGQVKRAYWGGRNITILHRQRPPHAPSMTASFPTHLW